MHRQKKNSRRISNHFWSKVEPLLPEVKRPVERHYQRKPGAGRKSLPARLAFEAILYVLRAGIPWKDLPKSFGSASAVHRRFRAWHDAGLFARLWQAGLAEDDEMEGIAWIWSRADRGAYGAFSEVARPRLSTIARLGESSHPTRRAWRPAIALRNRPKHSHRHSLSVSI